MDNSKDDLKSIFLTVDETADLLRITPKQVNALARQRRIPAVKFDRYWKIHKEKLIDLINQKTSFIIKR